MDTEHKCPQCGLDLAWDARACPLCERPLEPWELARGVAVGRARTKESRRRPLQLVGFAAVVVVGGALFQRWLPELERRFGPAPAPEARVPAAPAEPRPFAVAPPLERTPVPLREPAPAVRRPSEPPPQPVVRVPEGEWLLRGRLRDLKTLKAVPGARIEFFHEERRGAEIRTDEWGRFLVLLPRLDRGGLEASLSHRGYARRLLHEPDIPYARLTAAERAGLAESAAAGDLATSPLPEPREEELSMDVFAAPLP